MGKNDDTVSFARRGIDHGHKKGDKLLYHEDGYREFYLTYLGYSNLDDECFIAEDEVGDVSDDWLWDAIIEED